ncbi:MAG: HupE/UreJ family protein [Methylococcaceae bacterium]|nr:HupE/UreJ family protein [Methylococcaceae bacterium]
MNNATKKIIFIIILLLVNGSCFAHGVDSSTEQFLTTNRDAAIAPFLYIGAKHMLTGYDHLLFLVGVIFFSVSRPRYFNLRQSIYLRTQFNFTRWSSESN